MAEYEKKYVISFLKTTVPSNGAEKVTMTFGTVRLPNVI